MGGVLDFLGAGAEAVATVYSANSARRAVEETNQANLQESQRNRDFQASMSSSAYQRATADMKAAGINPMLAYMEGGASTPSGSMATVQAPTESSQILATGMQKAVSTALEQVRLKKDLAEKDSNIALNQAAKKREETQALLNVSSAKKVDVDKKTALLNIPAVDSEAQARKTAADIEKKPWYQGIKKTFGIGTSAVASALGLSKIF